MKTKPAWIRRAFRALPLAQRLKISIDEVRETRRARSEYWHLTPEDRLRMDFYSQFVSRGDLVFDVGANQGNRTKIFLELGCRVVAFEPQLPCAQYLEKVLRGRSRFKLVPMALGRSKSIGEMLVSDASVLSSMSPLWVDATKKSGRFASIEWSRRQVVSVTTLDLAIEEFGKPSFTKIDVEGYEFEVLSGLSTPLPSLSIEFTTEYLQNTYQSIDHLASFGAIEGQISYGESMELALAKWLPPRDLKEALAKIPSGLWGDVYIRSTTLPQSLPT